MYLTLIFDKMKRKEQRNVLDSFLARDWKKLFLVFVLVQPLASSRLVSWTKLIDALTGRD